MMDQLGSGAIMDRKMTNLDGLAIFAKPRPAMRDPYFIRNPRSARIINAVDILLALSNPSRSPPVALPALRLLGASFPGAEIGFLTGSWSRHVVEGTGLCDHLHLAGHFVLSRARSSRAGKIYRYLATRGRAVGELRAKGYEVAIDLGCHFPPASPLFYAAGIRVRGGFTSGGFGPLLTHPISWLHASRPISDYPRDLLSSLWSALTVAPYALAPRFRAIRAPLWRPN